MSAKYLMGLDAGGGGGRCLLVEVENGRIVTASRPWTHRPAPGTGGWGFDLDLERCWSLLAEAAREAMERAGAAPDQVLAVAAASMRHTAVVLDREVRIVLATPNRDARAAAEGMGLAAEHGPEFHQRTGHWPNPIFAAARLRWLAANDPTGLERATAFLSLSDWIGYRMCGRIAAEPSQAGETLLFDLETRDWAWDLIERLDLPRQLFLSIRQTGTRLGDLSRRAAAALGLKAGTPVAVGGADTQCGLLGMGAVAPGQMGAIAGTTTPVQLVVDRPLVDPEARMWTGHHVLPGLWVLESNAGSTGDALEWFAGAFYPDASQPLAMLSAEAGKSSPGAAGILSTIGADVMNASQMALPIGNLTMTHMAAAQDPSRRRHLARAILEGMAYALRANAQQILSVAEMEQPELGLAGGMVRSSLWAQIVSDVLNMPVDVPVTPEATALGAAICAGVGAGVFRDLAEGADTLARAVRQHTPDPQRAQTYRGLYAGWEQLREARAQADELAAGFALQALMSSPPQVEGAEGGEPFRPRILVTADLDEASLAELRVLGDIEYASYRQVMRLLTGPDLVEELANVHVFITEVDVVDAEALQQLPDLRAIIVCRGNVVNVDVAACTALGVPVINTPGRNADAVADLTLAFMLMLARKLPEAITFLYEPGGEAGDMARMGVAHQELQGHELWGKTVGLVGIGAVGRLVAQRLRPFGARVLAYDPFVSLDDAVLAGVELVSLETLLAKSDFVSLHAAVTDKSRGLFDAANLARMKPGAFLVNTARAALVDEAALVETLRSGHLGGAALDVFSVEPPGPDDPLLALPNVITTPHVGGNTFQVAAHQGRIAADAVRRLVRGGRPRHALNPETLTQFRWEGPREPLSSEALAELSKGSGPAVSDLELKEVQEVEKEARELRQAPPAVPEPEATGVVGKGLAGLRGLRDRLGRKPAPVDKPPAASPAAGPGGDQMERVLRAFITHIANDPALQDFASGRQLTMHYVLSDLGLEFYTSFHDGQVTGDLGAPPTQAEVRLKMKADILDGMFTGRTNATRAAMTGKLSFSGDTRLAMGMQRIQNDLNRLYTLAREEVVGSGDLDLTAVPSAVPAAPPTPASSPTPATAAPATPSLAGGLRGKVVQVVDELYTTGLITATGGNVSARIPGTDHILITPSQLFKGDLHPGVLVRIDREGKALDPDALSPSSEWPMHCAIYQTRPDVEAIVHTHAPQVTILGLGDLPFLPISTEAA
ncbi:MAG: NAD(P)-dependent oxidoreductase, partial [Anaerolineae bacterium]